MVGPVFGVTVTGATTVKIDDAVAVSVAPSSAALLS